MSVLPLISSFAEDLTAWRRDFHAHPEIGFEEVRTSGIVAELLESWGIAVTRGLGKTGVVGVLDGRGPGRTIGLRADMDALPMEERTNLAYASRNEGVFHGCGHDSHTAILLGTARYLAETGDFDGHVVFIFQPAEEGLGGARAMIADGLFEQFPCDELYAVHNTPYHPANHVRIRPGVMMAGAAFFDIDIRGQGSHGAQPHMGRDPVVVGAALVGDLQSIVSRDMNPVHSAVLSVTQFHGGTAYNIVPDSVRLSGTIRYFDLAHREILEQRMKALCDGAALGHDCEVSIDIRTIFSALSNDPDRTETVLETAAEIVGSDKVARLEEPTMGSEDFADMLAAVPGAYFTLGHSGEVPLHNPGFVLDDAILPVGASILARLVERRGTGG